MIITILAVIALLLAVISLVPQVPDRPLLSVAVLLLCICFLVGKWG